MSSIDPLSPLHRLTQATGFICDRCQEPITEPRLAWGQWFARMPQQPGDRERNWGFAIVHGRSYQSQCTLMPEPDGTIGDVQLDYLLSADGLVYLLEFLVWREVDAAEFCRFLMRLFVPGYEQAHRDIALAQLEGIREPASHPAFLTQSEIQSIQAARAGGVFDAYS
jgi:hypothetical protein